ncbi:MAG TPA: 6-phosphogluconolactonase [Burkholderiaceae bacterium]|nr:6-phosphogluconolactonase [Burkholderiaceae bacterium]
MWHDFDSAAASTEAQSRQIAQLLSSAVDRGQKARLAVSGGRSPIPLFERLSNEDIPWHNVAITLVDDRYVPVDHEDSNEALVRRYLLQNRASAASFTGLVGDADDIARSVERANRLTGHIDVAVLGMGDDGHTASLFPDAAQLPDALDPQQVRRYLHITPPTAAHERISMTLAALLAVGHLILPIAGEHKRNVLRKAQEAPTPALPVSYVATQHGVPLDVYWHP